MSDPGDELFDHDDYPPGFAADYPRADMNENMQAAIRAVQDTYVRFGWGGRAGSDELIAAALAAALPLLMGVQCREDVAQLAAEIELVFKPLVMGQCISDWSMKLLVDASRQAAERVLALPHTGQPQEGRAALKQRVAAGHWFKAFTSDEQVGAAEIGAFLDEIADAASPKELAP